MRKSLTKKVSLFMAVAMTMITLTGCNTQIKVSYDVNASDYINLGEYKGITASVDTASIENNLIEKRIVSDRDTKTTYSEVTREAKEEDKVTVTFYGTIGGQQISGFSNESYSMVIGKDTFPIDGFVDALQGMKAGDTKVITLTVPDNFSDEPEYAGRKIVYDITMNKVEQPNVPMITDAYVQQNFNYNTVAEYRQSIKDEIQSTIDEQVNSAKKEAVLTKLQDRCEVISYPEDFMNTKSEELNKSISFYCTMQGKSVEEYCQDTYKMSFDEYVKKAVVQELIFQEIIRKENLSITEYDYKGDLESFAKDIGYTDKQSLVDKYGKDKIVKSMLIKRAQDIVMNNAIFE